jgi:4-diphosphocytidyl-2-C-methyl-D-erythritol kinase
VPEIPLDKLLVLPVNEWRYAVVNDFERSIFRSHPILGDLKEALYAAGAFYASMSGSGSSLYGLFTDPPSLQGHILKHVVWKGRL